MMIGDMSPWLNWIERWPPEPKVRGSNPLGDSPLGGTFGVRLAATPAILIGADADRVTWSRAASSRTSLTARAIFKS